VGQAREALGSAVLGLRVAPELHPGSLAVVTCRHDHPLQGRIERVVVEHPR